MPRRGEPGRLRWKMAEMLQALGVEITPYTIYPTTGWYRTSRYADCYRWEGWGKTRALLNLPVGFDVHIYSWDTMTACARQGIELYQSDDGDRWSFGVAALEAR